MKGKLAAANITQIINELKKISSLNKIKKDKYISKLEELHKLYINIEIDEKFKIQYNRMNAKGKEVIKELKSTKEKNKIESVIEVYTRYLTASLCDFQGKTINLRKYITSFLFCAMLFLALTPQFFGFFLPILFFIPIYIGLKGVKPKNDDRVLHDHECNTSCIYDCCNMDKIWYKCKARLCSFIKNDS